jgi:site-specific recombinase XerD
LIEQLFPNPRSRQRFLDGPMGPYLEAFSSQLAGMGYANGYICNLVRLANSVGEWLEDHGVSPKDAGKSEIDAYIAAQPRGPRGRLPDWMRGIRRLPALVAPLGILCRPEPPSFVDPILERFGAYLGNVLGVTPNTSKSYRYYVRPFVAGVCANAPPDWTRMDAAYVATFVLKHAGRPNASRSRIVSAVRTFLRFLVSDRAVPASLLRAIPRIRQPWKAGVPRHLSAEELERVLEACQAQTNGSIRDRAFIALLARLGVRAGELRDLHLEDVEWASGLLHIRKSKSGNGRTLPLPSDAGALLVEYIRSGRPTSIYREIFLSAHPPHLPFGAAAATTLVRAFLKRIGLHAPGRGPHCFRHTAATHMVRNGARLKEVADVLGHRSLTATAIYVKVDEPGLKEVVLPWPGGDV